MNRAFLIFTLSSALFFTSCLIGDRENSARRESKDLTIRLKGVVTYNSTRATEDQASTSPGTIELVGGHIFIIDSAGEVIDDTQLKVDEARGELGQQFPRRVPDGSRVFIVCNIPSVDNATVLALETLKELQDYISDISTQSNYRRAVLVNDNFQAAEIAGIGSSATVAISIKPVISRLELVQVQGDRNIKSFTVSGVWLDSYYSRFTFSGTPSGGIFEQGKSTSFTGKGDAGSWTASPAAEGGLLVSSPGTGKVWAHNVVSGGTPRLIIRLSDVTYQLGPSGVMVTPGEGDPGDDGVRYLTVMSYSNMTTAAFEPGKIYRISNIGFDYTKLADTPNPTGLNLMVAITVLEWIIVYPEVNL